MEHFVTGASGNLHYVVSECEELRRCHVAQFVKVEFLDLCLTYGAVVGRVFSGTENKKTDELKTVLKAALHFHQDVSA